MTIHETSIDRLRQYQRLAEMWRGDHPRVPEWIADRIVASMRRAALRRAAREAVTIRQDRRWYKRDRRLIRETLAKSLHRLGYQSSDVDAISKALEGRLYCWPWGADAYLTALPAAPAETHYWDYGYSAQSQERWADERDPRAAAWVLWLERDGQAAISKATLARVLSDLASDPTATISGYCAASILAYAGRGGYDFAGCSGCAWYALLRDRPDLWDYLLSRAPTGAVLTDERGEILSEQVYPHEIARRDRLTAAGWLHTLRLNDSIYHRPSAQS